MLAIVAITFAVLFGAVAAWRLVPAAPTIAGHAATAAAVVGGAAALGHWNTVGDTRWLVGAGLLLAALVANLLTGGRSLRIGAMVLGDLALALFALAYVTGYSAP